MNYCYLAITGSLYTLNRTHQKYLYNSQYMISTKVTMLWLVITTNDHQLGRQLGSQNVLYIKLLCSYSAGLRKLLTDLATTPHIDIVDPSLPILLCIGHSSDEII